MLKPDHFCKFLNSLVKEYHFVIISTHPASKERKEAGKIYELIPKYVQDYSNEALNLNKLAPQTLHFLKLRGLKVPTKRVWKNSLEK
ncbi:hypothetical protein C7S20_05510 [Christiangramia fulva]|uniref:Uncharacterized protein n=1 Tax=Christiangramia fulva TaxID=2126553 RepID=A0A2R3Z3C8_9FLAO|nr:hypothetical protein [Christiangramia fulva]AVR44765.1 hypothetical protein C7S20_05510 [Christiangramia fulva]